MYLFIYSLIYFYIKEEDVTTDTARFSSSPFSHIVLLSVSQYHTDDRHGSGAAKKKKRTTLNSNFLS